MAFKLFMRKVGEFVFSKMAEKTADKAFDDLNNIKEFELILKTLQKNLKSLSAKAADVEEEIRNEEVSGRRKRKREVEEWLEQVKSIEAEVDELGSEAESEGFIARLMDGGKATRLNEQVEKLVQQGVSFGQLLLDVCGTRGEILLTNGMVGEAVNEDLEGILKLLENRQVLSIGVYGMGGVGKTTLAKYIHNRLLQQSQGRVFWITVSHEFTIKSLQDKLARSLGVDLSDEDDEAIRAGRLNRSLSEMKNSVLILDDVWEKIDMSKVGCTFSLECCRLIITTRSLDVCRRIGCMKVIQVVKLRRDEAWKLFNETLGKEIQLGPGVEKIARSMADVCDGLPLGIITVAGSMKGETALHTWRSALAELKNCVAGSQDDMGEVDEVFKVLKYSFDRLNRNYQRESSEFNRFQHCFLYCSLYPEDFKIPRDDLVGKLISERLMDGRRSRRAQVEQGHSILDKLVNLCLLESCFDYSGKFVKMHDLVRSMALRICKGKYMVRAGENSLTEIPNQQEWTKDLEKVSFVESGIREIEEGLSPDCPKLSTLLLPMNGDLKAIPESFFSKMQGLCTLDLSGNSQIAMLPNSVSDLTSLKSLLLENCERLEKVPYLGKLKELRELNLTGTSIEEVPQGLEELLNLRFLSDNSLKLKLFPQGLLLRLGHLEHLNIPFDIQVEIEEMENLKGLEEFGGGVKSVSDFNRFISTRKVHDPCYGIRVNSKWRIVQELRGKRNELSLFESKLSDEKVLGKGIADLTISSCEGLSKLFEDDLSERFENPTSLKTLIIDNCRGIEWMMRSDDGQGLSNTTLEEIELVSLADLKGVVVEMERGEIHIPSSTVQPAVFSCLGRIKITKCNKMRKMGLHVSTVPNLEYICIMSCGEIQEIFEDEGRAAASTLALPKLKNLTLYDLPILKRVSKATIISNSIQYIYIRKCPELMVKLPLNFECPTPPPSLIQIKVDREWWESLEWDSNPNLPQLLCRIVPFD